MGASGINPQHHKGENGSYTFLPCFCFMFMVALPAWTFVHQMPKKAKENVGSPGAVVTGSCELPRGCWKLNSGPLEAQQELLTSESSLQPQVPLFFITSCVKYGYLDIATSTNFTMKHDFKYIWTNELRGEPILLSTFLWRSIISNMFPWQKKRQFLLTLGISLGSRNSVREQLRWLGLPTPHCQ